MGTFLDEITEGQRERELMQLVREQKITPEELERVMVPFPIKIQIQTASPCNAACVMCPWPDTKKTLPQGRMSEELFEKLVLQLVGKKVERTSLFLMNEPLLDKRLARFTRFVKKHLPETATVIYTNGELLTAEKAIDLAESGMDEINVSVVGFDRAGYESIMKGIDYDVVMANLDAVGTLARAGKLGKTAVRIVGLEFDEAVRGMAEFEARTGLEVLLKQVTTRAGLIDLDELGIERKTDPRFRACQRPFVKAYVLYNGDLVLCNCDWERVTVMGNVGVTPLSELWVGAQLSQIRREHLLQKLTPGSLCAKCDYPFLP